MESFEIYELDETSSKIKQCGPKEFKIISKDVYGFNPGQNVDIKTNIMINIPKGKAVVITPARPLLLIGSPFFNGGKLTMRLHNSQTGKYGTYIVGRNEELCKLTVVSTE